METLKTSETLVKGLVASKQDGTGNLVEETFPGVSKSFDLGEEKCAESMSAPVGEAGCIELCNVEGFERVLQPAASIMEIDSRVDSNCHGDVPIKGISLFVELTGGVTIDASHHLEEHVSLGNRLDGESMCDVNGGLLHKNQGEVIVGHQECRVNMGDFVWAMTKNQSWWPGIVCDATNAPKEAAKVQRREDDLLVRCFGNGSYIWCLPSQLKPFVGYFEQLSKQSNSKSFVGALEKAVAELGRHVKAEFTCSCFAKTMVERRGDVGDLSATQFEPATFVEYIKDLARDISMPSKIDYAVNQNCLSAFYRSLGHCQIPMHQLKPANSAKAELTSGGTVLKMMTGEENGFCNEDTNTENKDINFIMGDDIKSSSEKTEKPYETRERRKSRFLSYPYTNLNAGQKGSPVSGERVMEESRTDINGGVDLNKTNSQPVKKSRKKWCRKLVTKHDLPGKGVQANVCSSEVLSDLHCAALDCLFPNESKKFVSVERFISGFRKWAFDDFTSEITIDRTVGQVFGIEMHTHQILPEIGVQSEKGMGMERTIDVNTTVDIAGKGTRGQPVLSTLPKKVRKKKDKSISSPMSGNNSNHGSVIIDFQNVGSLALEAQMMANKRMEMVADQGLRNNEVIEAVSDLNGKYTILKFGDLPVTEPPPCKPKPKRRKKNVKTDTSIHARNSNVSTLPNVNGHMDRFLIPQKNDGEGLTQATAFHLTNGVVSAPSCFTGNHGEPQVGIISAGVNLEPKKRGRKRKNMDLQVNAGSTIMPDLKENGAEKKKGRRCKRKEETGVPCIDLSYNKVQQDNGEVTGTAFLLKFSPDHPLPSIEDLNSIFCKYGALHESETQVLNEILSGQVVFLDSSSAGEAFWGLQNDHPFGQALVNYRIQHLSSAESTGGFKTPIKIPSGLRPLQQGESNDSLAITGSTMIPDLNGNAAENILLKRCKTKEEILLPSMDLSYSKVQQGNGEVMGTALLLKFSPDHPLPSNEDLNSVFCKYGALNAFEIRLSSQNLSGQVVFVNPSSAGEAVQSLEKDKPFGQALVSCRVQQLSSAQAAIRFKTPIKIPLGLKPPQQGEAPDLAVIRKNLEMMTLMLEKAGDTLSPEMRAKLEGEIKGLMNKVSTMDGSSSSSL